MNYGRQVVQIESYESTSLSTRSRNQHMKSTCITNLLQPAFLTGHSCPPFLASLLLPAFFFISLRNPKIVRAVSRVIHHSHSWIRRRAVGSKDYPQMKMA